MGTYILKRKNFTVYDETDELKRMKDSDILAERKKNAPGYGSAALQAGTSALTGAALAAGYGLLTKGRGGARFNMNRAGRLAKTGAIVGLSVGAIKGLNARKQEAREVKQYNNRLDYAQRQAARREKKDWTANMTQRDGYSY